MKIVILKMTKCTSKQLISQKLNFYFYFDLKCFFVKNFTKGDLYF